MLLPRSPMEAILSAAALKPFAKILQTLNRVGEDLYIQARGNKLVLSTVNASRSAFVLVTLQPAFFDTYSAKRNTDDQGPTRCHVLLKPLLNIFRAKASTTTIESCRLSLPTAIASTATDQDRLIITLHCKHGITKTHKLHYAPTDPLTALYTKNACRHKWTISSKLSHDWVNCFWHRLEEVTLGCGRDYMRLKSFSEDAQPEDPISRSLQTELQVNTNDFDLFSVQHDVHLTISLKDFKTVLSFADAMSQPVSAYFDHAGSPIIFNVTQPPDVFTADFVLASLRPPDEEDDDLQTSGGAEMPMSQHAIPSQQYPTQQPQSHPTQEPEADDDDEVLPPSPQPQRRGVHAPSTGDVTHVSATPFRDDEEVIGPTPPRRAYE
ncbi:hypothetical protein SpCBS45565_g03900 [Spizellomyces sp. 'palustris']|nr:hypothetical protein SpCBS45565_g03900 [Spizellomyces sp. 'palustris']